MKAQTMTLLLPVAVLFGCAPTPELVEPRAEPPADRATSGAPTSSTTPSAVVSPAAITAYEDVSWEDLNPARGDQSPRAGTLWGDRKGKVATGYLLRPVDGFRSPPHIHNVTYRAVVIRGVLHNDDEQAEEMWMPAGSFWTQPKGASHITSAKGKDTLAYIEIDEGPYLVHPIGEAFDTPERPVNVHVSNVVWVPSDNASSPIEVAYLWGQPYRGTSHGLFVKLPAGAKAALSHDGDELHAVVVAGLPSLALPDAPRATTLSLGTHFSSTGKAYHPVACADGADCVLYIRASGVLRASPRS